MKINSTPIPNSTVLGDTAADLVLRGEHPDKRSDKEFIELMHARGLERDERPYDHRNSIKIKCINTGEVFPSFNKAAAKFNLSISCLSDHIRLGRKFRYHKDLRFELIK